MSLDTTVDGDYAGITSAATGLGTLGQGFTSTASSVGAAGSLSESLWTGSAGDAFRGGLLPVRRAIDEVAGATERANQAMQTFAAELKAVQDKIEQARSIASAAGLEVGGDSIEPPKPPPVPRALTLTPAAATEEATQLAAAQAEYRRQLRAYKQAEQLMKEARTQEKKARADLGRAMAAVKTLLDDINEQKFWLAGGAGAEVLSRAVKAADRWAELARLTEKYRWLEKWSRPGSGATVAEIAERIERMEELRGRGPIPPNEAKGAQWLDTLLGDSKIRGLLRKAGWIGFGAQAITDIVTKKGTERAKAVGIDAASFGGGALAGDAFLSAMVAGGVAGAPETLGASLVATAAGIAIYEGLHHPGAVKDGAGWVWDHPWAVAGVPVVGAPVAIGSGVVHGAGAIINHAGDIKDAIGGLLP